ncbi:hypothetical protein [Endozoicomonas lisbonensis]|uniref:Uncharacterized protein n=1 Tax=Endozoicomonas lisbonensis TaxID=3120522 RepID=A0ABV2SER0_9GAMM
MTSDSLSTSKTVREAMMRDRSNWGDDYNLGVVETIKQQKDKLPGTNGVVPTVWQVIRTNLQA